MPFGDYPTTQQKIIPYKLIGIIGGGVILSVVIIGVIVRFVNQPKINSAEILLKESEMQSLSQCDSAENKEGCIKSVADQLNRELGTVKGCELLTDRESDSCVWTFARTQADATVCEMVKADDLKVNCYDSAYYAQAKRQSDKSNCAKIVDESFRRVCIQEFEPSVTSINCLSLGKTPMYCQAISITEEAKTKQDRALCSSIQDQDLLTSCFDQVEVDDPDFDLLATALESYYKTDPRNPDSDADGYKDGDEVAAGFNPAGPGKLEIKTAPPEPFILPF